MQARDDLAPAGGELHVVALAPAALRGVVGVHVDGDDRDGRHEARDAGRDHAAVPVVERAAGDQREGEASRGQLGGRRPLLDGDELAEATRELLLEEAGRAGVIGVGHRPLDAALAIEALVGEPGDDRGERGHLVEDRGRRGVLVALGRSLEAAQHAAGDVLDDLPVGARLAG